MIACRVHRKTALVATLAMAAMMPGPARAAAEVNLDADFLGGVVEKLPPVPFQDGGRYRGTVHGYRLLAIDPRARRFLVACQVEGEFRPPIAALVPGRSADEGWKKFRFDVQAGVHVEPALGGIPRIRVEVEEVKRRELEGLAGTLAKVLGRSFDELVTQIADGKANRLGERLNEAIVKRIGAFQEYGVFQAIDYAPTLVVLHFDVTRLKLEGIVGHVFPTPRPGTVPLTRWLNPKRGNHFYTTIPAEPDRRSYRAEGVACHVFPGPVPGSVPLYRWRSPREPFYTTAPDGGGVGRLGYRFEGVACSIYPDEQPGTVPLYRFVDPRNGIHFYTTHPHAEFAK